jgi:hypothetical protein
VLIRGLGAIAWRLLITGRAFKDAKLLSSIAFAIVESSALYTLGVAITLSTFLNRSNAQYPAADAIAPLVVSLCTSPHLSNADPRIYLYSRASPSL